MTTQENTHWKIEDLGCWAGCPLASYDALVAWLDDPANDHLSWGELNGRYIGHQRQFLASISTEAGKAMQQSMNESSNPSIHCADYGYMRQTINPLPMQISVSDDILTIRYEEWNLSRTVYMDGRGFPDTIEHSRLGYSIGRMDGNELVIETRGIDAEVYNPFQGGGGHSDQLNGVERYRIEGSPPVLKLNLSLEDPVTLNEPYVFYKQWLLTPEIELLEDFCSDVPGEF